MTPENGVSPTDRALSGRSVLIVEDSPTQALSLRLSLEAAGFEVACAASAEEALERLREAPPQLIVADHHLPGMTGRDLCRTVRMNLDTRHLPILMLTADESDDAELDSLDSGADDYVSKSADAGLLRLRIESLLRKSSSQETILKDRRRFDEARVLVIDDSPTFLQLIDDELRREGYRIDTAPDGEQGLRLVRSQPFDCVIVDLHMPGLDGIEVCRQISDRRRSLDEPIIVMLTASESRQDMGAGLQAGADDFVGKTSDMSVLKARIRALLRRKFFQQENRQIVEELKTRELEAMRARAEKEAAEQRAALSEELRATNERLRATQSQLVQSEKMASLGQLTAGIAHEINNPLAFVLSSVDTVDRAFATLEAEGVPLPSDVARRVSKGRTRLADMRDGLVRVRELVVKLRTFSRLDEGDVKTVDLHEGLESVLLFLQHRTAGVDIVRRYGAEEPVTCMPGELNQVFMNVLANAVDAVEAADGDRRITIETRQDGPLTFITIADSGPGIPEEHLARLFEPFFTTKAPGDGTGLGLSIAYGIVRAHGGQIEVQSAPGAGTEFRIRIPTHIEERRA